jgi:hypothetical protein
MDLPISGARVKPGGDLWSGTHRIERGGSFELSNEGLRPTIVLVDATGLVWERVGTGDPERIYGLTDYLHQRVLDREAHWRAADEVGTDYASSAFQEDEGDQRQPAPTS